MSGGVRAAAPQNSYDCEAFGQAVSVSENVTQPFRFTGRAWDGNSGLHYYRTRYYNPSLGVFTQKDREWRRRIRFGTAELATICRLLPLYAYATNNPVLFKDSWGRLITDAQCKCERNNAIMNDRVIGAMFMKAVRSGCLDQVYCFSLPGLCPPGVGARYTNEVNDRTGQERPVIILCRNNLNPGEVKDTLHHELEHALSVCGKGIGPDQCGRCLIEEMRAYYCANHCDWPLGCAIRALGSCRERCRGRARTAFLTAQMDPPICMEELLDLEVH